VPLGTAHAVVSLGDRAAAADLLGAAPWERRPVWNALALPLNALVWSAGFPEVRVGFTDTTLAASLRLDRLVGGADPEVGVWVLGAAPASEGTFGGVVSWVPAEPSQGLGRAWRAAVAPGAEGGAFTVGLANGAISYLLTREEWAHGGYESQASFYGPGAGEAVGAALVGAREDVRKVEAR
jgi:hypothetical protein